jgi:hypothetical protein
MEQLSPYMPPALIGTRYVWFQDGTLYVSITRNQEHVYQERLENLLKEEFDFIKEIKFILENNNE